MKNPALVANTRLVGDEEEVLAPAVGWWSAHPIAGSMLSGGSRIGSIEVLGRHLPLVLPSGVWGVVNGRLPGDRRVAVEYGETLFRLGRLPDPAAVGESHSAPGAEQAGSATAAGWALLAPTDGVFYRRASPTDPPFVDVGSHVCEGQAVGLVESMKTFNQILVEGEACPQEGEVAEILCEDGAEVTAGQVLMRIR